MSECSENKVFMEQCQAAFEAYESAVRGLETLSGAERSEELKRCIRLFHDLQEARDAMHGYQMTYGLSNHV